MKIISLLLCSLCLLLSGCDNYSQKDYDNGYEDAWSGEVVCCASSSKEYLEGYNVGISDADTYDDGYCDGIEGYPAAYPTDPDYMDGFIDGKEDK